jgi:hypothetical protein
MTRWAKDESLTVVCDGLFQIFHCPQLLKASGKGGGEVAGRRGTIWMARRAKRKRSMVVCDSLFQILHLSQLSKAS